MIIRPKNQAKGFTLIEILIVIGIIAILAAIVIIAINPAKQFAQARNSQRTANVNAILNAIGQRMADNKGVFEGSFDGGTYDCDELPTGTADDVTDTNGTDASGNESGNLGCLIPTYLPSMPFDPEETDATPTGYTVIADTNGRVTVCAPNGKEDAIPDSDEICVTR